MLSMSKLVAGQTRYYLDRAEGRVDVIESIGDGVEEYYVGGTEARGQWMGAGALQLGLVGPVVGEQLRRVFDGLDSDDHPLRDSTSPVRIVGYDLTLSAPKSVSVLFGLGDQAVQHIVRAAHDRAVSEAFGHVERSAAAVRRGHGGARVEPADGLIGAAFRHRTSRAGDPQLHTHVLVANLGRGPDGRWSALDGRRLYAQARSASFIYQAVLRAELTRSLGVEWMPVRRGIAEVLGVPKPVLRAFSRRRAQIEAAMRERGTSSARAAEAAALDTRRPKDRSATADGLAVEWRARAADLGFDTGQLVLVVGRVRESRTAEPSLERVFDALAAATGLTREKSTFDRRDVIQALCERAPAEAAIDARSLEAAADAFLSSGRTVALLPEHASFRRRDGRLLPLAREQLRYSTPELLALEQRLVDRAMESGGAGAGVAGIEDVRRMIDARPTLSDEQRRMIERLCRDGDQVAVVAGKAGTGKTYALAAAREAWQAAGHPVLGVAVARRAARELQTGAGVQSTSTVALLGELARTRRPLPTACVLVADEAGMVPTRQLAALLEHVERAGGKLVLVGDHRQLPELEAGGAFRALVRRGLAIELTANQRQVEQWERTALDHVSEGRAEAAVALYDAQDRIRIGDTTGETRERLVADWWAAQPGGDAVMIAHRRADVADLNARAREIMRAGGALTGAELDLPGGAFSAGDRVVIKRNELGLDVANGDRGRVLAVDPEQHRLLLETNGRAVEVGAEFLDNRTEHGDATLVHGYAITCHIAQGLTTDRAFVLAEEGISRELGYTALSRGRHGNYLYLTREPDDVRAEYAPVQSETREPMQRLIAALKTSTANTLAIDADPAALVADAAHRHATAVAQRHAIEQSRWKPGRRRQLEGALERERKAARMLAHAKRTSAEVTYGRQPFVSEQDLAADVERRWDRLAERQLQRSRGRGAGRGLER